MWGQLAGAAMGAIGGGKSQSSGGTPKFVKKQIKRGFGNLNAAAERAPTDAIAGFNGDQTRAMQMVRDGMGRGASTIADAIAGFKKAAGGVGAGDIAGFMNPYEDAVVASATRDLNYQRDQDLLGITSQAEKANAFGGDRAVVASQLAKDQWGRTIGDTIGNLRYGGYQSAVDSAFRNNETQRAGYGNLLDAALTDRSAYGQDAQALAGIGDVQRAYDQSLLDHPFLMAQAQVNAGTSALGASNPTTSGGGISGALAGMGSGMTVGGDLEKIWT
jgi:hypothetical protein